jgi:hypothetical protein
MALNVIKLFGDGVRDTPKAGGTITPGDILEKNSDGDVIRHAVAGGIAVPMVALENTPFNKGIDDDYADDDQVQIIYPEKGGKYLLWVVAGGAAIVQGDYLESAAGGSVRKLAAGVGKFQAEEDVDNSGGGTRVRIKATAI